jgi:hypothetical protein
MLVYAGLLIKQEQKNFHRKPDLAELWTTRKQQTNTVLNRAVNSGHSLPAIFWWKWITLKKYTDNTDKKEKQKAAQQIKKVSAKLRGNDSTVLVKGKFCPILSGIVGEEYPRRMEISTKSELTRIRNLDFTNNRS